MVLFLLTFYVPNLGSHTKKDDVISILMHKYTYTNMYIIMIIKKIISCRFILCWGILYTCASDEFIHKW